MEQGLLAQQALHKGPGLGIFSESAADSFSEGGGNNGGGTASPAAGAQAQGNAKNKGKDDGEAGYCTVMLRNIPNKYTRQMLVDQLYRMNFKGEIDYLYLPTDFANRCNVGYAFLNFRSVAARVRFNTMCDGVAAQTCLPGFNSYKVCQVTKAKIQGREENLRRLRSSPDLMVQLQLHPEWLPLLLDANGEEEPFPFDEGSFVSRGGGGECGGGMGSMGGKGGIGGVGGGGGGFAPKRQSGRRRNQMLPPAGPLAFPQMEQGAVAGTDWIGASDAMAFAQSRGRGGGKGSGKAGGGKVRRGGPHPMGDGMPQVPFPGFPIMGMPVVTEQGLSYMPYPGFFQGYPGFMGPSPYPHMDPSCWGGNANFMGKYHQQQDSSGYDDDDDDYDK